MVRLEAGKAGQPGVDCERGLCAAPEPACGDAGEGRPSLLTATSEGLIEQPLHPPDNRLRELDVQGPGDGIEQLEAPRPRLAVGSAERARLRTGRTPHVAPVRGVREVRLQRA